MTSSTTAPGRPFHFITGLPRSGSTLLSGILLQNPRFHAGMTSLVGSLCSAVLGQVSAGTEFAPVVDRDKRRALLRGLVDSYYADVDKEVIFDTNRAWSAMLPLVRDLFPQAAAAIALGQPDALAAPIDRAAIPDVPPGRVAYIDGYGNLKTTIAREAILEGSGTSVRVRIGQTQREAIVSDGSFAVEPGQLALAPGSSGWTDAQGRETRWVELFLRGGNAWEGFGRPEVGAAIQIGGSP